MRDRSPRPGSRGVSLIEAIVTLALISIALLALAPLFTQSVNMNASSNQTSIANSLAREKLEELLLYPTTDVRLAVPAGATTATFPNDLPTYWEPATGKVSKAATTPGTTWVPYPFTRTYTVEPFVTDVSPNPLKPTASALSDESTYNLPGPGLPYYEVKLVTVSVTPTAGPFPGLRRTTQSAYVRYRNVLPN